MSDESSTFAFPQGVLVREVGGEMVLLNLESEQYFGLDKVGTDIVNRLTRQPFRQAFELLCQSYEVDAETLRADVDRLTGELLRKGLLERTDSHGS